MGEEELPIRTVVVVDNAPVDMWILQPLSSDQWRGRDRCPPSGVGRVSCQGVSTRKPRSIELYVKTVPFLVSGGTLTTGGMACHRALIH